MSPEDIARLEEEERQRRTAAANNVAMSGRNPALVARAKRLATLYGVATPLVEAEPEVFEKQLQRDKTVQETEKHPWMVPMLFSEPDLGAMLGKDDLSHIGDISRAFGMEPREATKLGDPIKPVISDAITLKPRVRRSRSSIDYRPGMGQASIVLGAFGEAVTNTASIVLGGLEWAADTAGFSDETDAYFRQQEEIKEQTLKNLRPEWLAPGTIPGDMQSGLASAIQMLLPLPLGKGAVLPVLAGVTAGSAYTKYQGRGASYTESTLGAAAEGAIEYGTERLPMKYLFGDSFLKGGAADFVKHYVIGDILGEQLATIGQDAVDTAIANPDKTWSDYWQERPAAALSTLISTLTTTALVGGGAGVMRRFSNVVDDARNGTEALHGQVILDEIMSKAEKVELRTSSPDEFAKFVNEGAKGSPVRNVYIPVEAIDKALEGELPDDEREALTFYQEQIDEARLTQGDVVISIGDAAASFAGTTVWQSLREEARVLQGGMSGREAQEKMDTLVQELEAVGNAAFEEARTVAPDISSKAAVYDAVKKQVLSAGRSTKEAQTTAALLASRAENLASPRYGQFKSAEEAWKWMQLKVVGADAKVPKGKKVKQSAVVNIGLDVNDGSKLSVPEVVAALTAQGVEISEQEVRQSGTEPTLVAKLSRALTPEQAHAVSEQLRQDAIAQKVGDAGELFGPAAEKWGPFNPEYFLDLTPTTLQQSDLPAGEQPATALGALELATSRKFSTMRDFKAALQDAVKAAGVGNLRDRARLTRLAIADAQVALQNNRNAIGWYDDKLQQALAVLGELHPEINTDEDARFAFIYALAVTSTGLKVDRNFKLADTAYREYKKSGKMPMVGEGNGANAMKVAFTHFNRLKEEMGIAGLRDFMTSEHEVREIEKAIGVPVNGEHKGTKVTGAAFLGPKIGNGYFSNLYGNYNQLTMDRWFMRTWGRWTGTLIVTSPTAIKSAQTKVKDLLRGLSPADKKTVNSLLSTKTKPFKLSVQDPDAFAKAVALRTVKAEVREGLAAVHPRLRLDAKNLHFLLDGQKEAPSNAAERNEIRALMGPVLSHLQNDNPELTMADLQAVLWYPEKTLYDTAYADVGKVAKTGYENEEAPDYANAAVALARAEGVSEDKINAAVKKGRGRAAAAQRARRAGRGAGEERIAASVAEDENGFPLEEGLVSAGDGTHDPMVLQQFGGKVAARASSSLRYGLRKAEYMEQDDRTPEEIWTLTGWTRGADGEWRFEIDDSDAFMIDEPSAEIVDLNEAVPGIDYMPDDPTMDAGIEIPGTVHVGARLGKVLKHPKLFELYPTLANMAVFVIPLGPRLHGYFQGDRLVLNSEVDAQQRLSTLMHETQHAIQMLEGFAGGADMSEPWLRYIGLGDALDAQIAHLHAINRGEIPGWKFEDVRTDEQLQQTALFMVYERVAGEVEARNTQTRQHYSAAQRRAELPEITADVGRDNVLIPFEERRIAAASQSGPEGPTQLPPRGETTFYPDGQTIVQLFKADFSTMLHELGHVFLQQEFQLAKEKGASEELKADIEALTKWFTKNGGSLKNGMPDVAAHELFARTSERYFREGKAPSAELRGAFKQFKTWLTGVYKSVKDLLAYGPSPINPEIREIMDRMIATGEAIDLNSTAPLSQEELGMTDAEYAAYIDSVQGARDDAFDTMLERMMKAIKRRETNKGREQRAEVRAEVADRVNAEPRFVALHLLRTGRWLGDPSREPAPVKLNTGWLIDNYGEEVLALLPVGLQPLHRGDGVVGDVVADMVGFASGNELVEALLDIKQQADALKKSGNPRPLRDHIIEQETDEIMAERHGDVAMSEEDIEEEAIAALNATRQGEVLAAELRQLKKQRDKSGVVTPYQLLREWARRKVNEGSVNEAVSKSALQRFIRGYNKARNLFETAILKGDKDEAIKQKQAQMINHALLAEGKVVADEINTIVRRMQRYSRTKAMSSIDQDYMDRIHELLEGYSFRTVSDRARAEQASFEAWAETQRALGHEVHVPPRFRDERTNWKDAKVAKLLELNDMVQSLAAQGRLKQRLTTAAAERALQETVDDIESRILQLPPRALPDSSTGKENKPFRQSLREAKTFADWREAVTRLFRPSERAREISAGLIKIEGLMDILDGTKDGTGPLNQSVVQPATDAANTFSQLLEEVMEPIIQRYKSMSGKHSARLRDFVTIPELTLNVSIHEADTEKLGQPLTIPRMKLLGLILNTGNLSNLSKLVGGERWGDPESASDLARVRDILVSYASKEDLDLVQDIWNGVSKLWPHIARVERELSGIVPEQVVPMPFETPHGPYSGGYWPVVWDSTRSQMGKKQGEEAETNLQGVGFGIATPKGHTITRTGAMAPMEWSVEHVLFGHLTKVISRIAYAPWVRDTLKVVDNSRVTGAIRLRLGNEYVAALKPWIRDQIPSNTPDIQGAKWWEKFLNAARVNMSIAVLGVSYSTGVAQMLGLGYSAGVLGDGSIKDGGKWMSRGLLETVKLMKKGLPGAQEFVFERSAEMARRAHEVNQEAAEVFRKLRDHDSVYRRLQAASFWHIGFIDINMVAIPSWLGGYHKALSEGHSEEEAIHYAEKVVRLSQSSGRKKDLSAIQRGNAGQKFISMFYTPSSVFFNQQWEAAQHLKAGNWSKALAPTFWFLVMTTLADAMREGDWPEDDDDDGLGGMDIAEWVARNLLFGMFYGVPVARDATNAAERKLRGEYAEYGTTPLTFAASTIERGAKSAGKAVRGEEVEGRDIKNQVSAMGFLLGLPGNQLGKSAGFVKDVYDGKVEVSSAYDWYHGLAYGKPPAKQE